MTEAGAEGLNLQFCNLVVNYDLPWNPQRVEQRIGRCHRYGQQRDVLVLNFLNRQNAADARLYELLSQKLALFDGVFGSSDEILGALGERHRLRAAGPRHLPVVPLGRGDRRRVRRSCAASSTTGSPRGSRRRARSCSSASTARCAGSCASPSRTTKEAVARREAEEDALVAAVFEDERRARRRRSTPAAPERPRRAAPRRAKLVREAAEKVRARPQDAVSFLEVPSVNLPAKLGRLAGREGWWFAYKFSLDALVSEEKVVHLVLWYDGERFRPLTPEDADAFARAARPRTRRPARVARRCRSAARRRRRSRRIHARLVQDLQERIGAAYRRVARSLGPLGRGRPRRAAQGASRTRAPRGRRRAARCTIRSDLSLRDRRALLERAEREYRRKLDDLRATEGHALRREGPRRSPT